LKAEKMPFGQKREKMPFEQKPDQMSFEQKLWKGMQTLIWAVRPALLYLFLPPLLMSVGMALFGGRSAGRVIADSGNFYYALGILLTLGLLYKRSRKNGGSLFEESGLELKRPDGRRIALLAATGLGLAVFFSAVITIIPFPRGLKESYRSSSDLLSSKTDLALAMISTVFLAPVAEEIVFRGYMLGRLLRWFTERQAILLSAVLFAVCHVSPIWVLYACLMGIMLAWVSIREDNTLYSIALHIGFNASVLPVSFMNGHPAWERLFFGSRFRIALIGGAALAMAVRAFEIWRKSDD
jgi:membrane protease YdiL (CAAX protease family)